MKLAKKTVIKVTAEEANIIGHECYSSSKLWNIANYRRKHYKELGIDPPNWYTQKKELKDNMWFKQLPSNTAQETLKDLDEGWSSFFALLESGKVENPHPPGFKQEPMYIVYLVNAIKHESGSSKIRLSIAPALRQFMSDTYGINSQFLYLENRIFKDVENIKQIQIFPPVNNECEVIVVYEIEDPQMLEDNGNYLSIDIGVHNFLTCYNSTNGETFIMGRKYLSTDRYFYKKIAHKQEQYYRQQKAAGVEHPKMSQNVKELYEKRRHQQSDYLHKMTRDLVKYCVKYNIHTVVVGDITGIRKKFKGSDAANQKLHSLPYKKVIGLLTYKLALHGIRLVMQNEAWTSQCSPLSKGVSKRYAKKENRVQRGLYIDGKYTWNADTVGAFNILRKYLKKQNIQKELNPLGIKPPFVWKVSV